MRNSSKDTKLLNINNVERLRTDVLTAEQRSYCMSRIKGKNTGPELILRKALWSAGLRYRLGYKLPGKPDLVFVSSKTVVFIDGCFWHGCPLHVNYPKTNEIFWREKITKNINRDKMINENLKALGWNVMRFWEHEIEEGVSVIVEAIMENITKRAITRDSIHLPIE